jgi:hypothetical protein
MINGIPTDLFLCDRITRFFTFDFFTSFHQTTAPGMLKFANMKANFFCDQRCHGHSWSHKGSLVNLTYLSCGFPEEQWIW